MTRYIFLIIWLLVSSTAHSRDYGCAEHENVLTVIESGIEHVNHAVILNKSVSISELESEMWFVESVSCLDFGFKISASHRQYNDPTVKEFVVKVTSSKDYEITTGI